MNKLRKQRVQKRSDIALRVGVMIGIDSPQLKYGYLTKKDWVKLHSTIEIFQSKIKEINNDTARIIES